MREWSCMSEVTHTTVCQDTHTYMFKAELRKEEKNQASDLKVVPSDSTNILGIQQYSTCLTLQYNMRYIFKWNQERVELSKGSKCMHARYHKIVIKGIVSTYPLHYPQSGTSTIRYQICNRVLALSRAQLRPFWCSGTER